MHSIEAKETDKGTFEWFRKEHGENGDYVINKGWYLFRNGARICVNAPLWYPAPGDPSEYRKACAEAASYGLKPPARPPLSEKERALKYELSKEFLQVRLKDAQQSYETLEQKLREDAIHSQRTGAHLPFGEEQLRLLKQRKDALVTAKREFDELTAEERQQRQANAVDHSEYQSENRAAGARALRTIESL